MIGVWEYPHLMHLLYQHADVVPNSAYF